MEMAQGLTSLLFSNAIDVNHQNSCLFTNKDYLSSHIYLPPDLPLECFIYSPNVWALEGQTPLHVAVTRGPYLKGHGRPWPGVGRLTQVGRGLRANPLVQDVLLVVHALSHLTRCEEQWERVRTQDRLHAFVIGSHLQLFTLLMYYKPFLELIRW